MSSAGIGRSRSPAVHEIEFARTLTDTPGKVALPGPYLLTRIMWMECVSDRAYRSREHLAEDIARTLSGTARARCRPRPDEGRRAPTDSRYDAPVQRVVPPSLSMRRF